MLFINDCTHWRLFCRRRLDEKLFLVGRAGINNDTHERYLLYFKTALPIGATPAMYALPHIECGPYWTCHSDMSHFTITRVGLLGTCNIYGKVEEMSQHAINITALYFVHCVWHMHFAQQKWCCSDFLNVLPALPCSIAKLARDVYKPRCARWF